MDNSQIVSLRKGNFTLSDGTLISRFVPGVEGEQGYIETRHGHILVSTTQKKFLLTLPLFAFSLVLKIADDSSFFSQDVRYTVQFIEVTVSSDGSLSVLISQGTMVSRTFRSQFP